MRGSHRFALLCAVAFTSAALLPAASHAAKRVTFREVASSVVLGPDDRAIFRLFRAEGFAPKPHVAAARKSDERDIVLSTVDLSRRALILLADEVRGSPAWQIEVDSVVLDGRTLTVTATASAREGDFPAALARPWTVVSVPRAAVARARRAVRVKVTVARTASRRLG